MNTRKFSDAISEIDDKYYEEAANYQSRRKKNTWIACGSIAAMLAIMVYAGTRFLPQKAPETAAERPMLTISENVSDGMGFESYNYGFSTAVGLFNSVVNTIFLLTTNYFAGKYSETSLF